MKVGGGKGNERTGKGVERIDRQDMPMGLGIKEREKKFWKRSHDQP